MLARVVEELKAKDPELLRNIGESHVRAGSITALQRALERSIDRRPSLLTQIGLTAIQVLSGEEGADAQAGTVERMTVAFTDLEGFTEYTATRGDEEASRLLVEHHRVVGPLVRARGGQIVKRLGDGLLLTFPHAAAAVMACLELVDAEPAPLRLRAGAHAGSVVSLPDDVIGHVVNVAARVAEAADGGQVLVTDVVTRLVAGDLPKVEFGEATAAKFKGINDEVPVCRAIWRR